MAVDSLLYPCRNNVLFVVIKLMYFCGEDEEFFFFLFAGGGLMLQTKINFLIVCAVALKGWLLTKVVYCGEAQKALLCN